MNFMKQIKPIIIMVLVLLFIPVGCGSRDDLFIPTQAVETTSLVPQFTDVEQRSTITAVPTATQWVNTITPATTKSTLTASPTPIATERLNLPKGRFLVTALSGAEGQNASFVRYYDKDNQLVQELTIPNRIIEVSTSSDGRFLVYYGGGKWVGDSLLPYDGVFIYDTTTSLEQELNNYKNCTGPGDWSPESYRLAIACEDIKVIAYVNNQWVEEGTIPLSNEYDAMPVDLRPLLVAPAWSPDGKLIAYILDHSRNLPGAATGPYVTDVACVTNPINCRTKTKIFKEAVNPTSVITWSVDGKTFYIANGDEGSIIAVGIENGKPKRILATDKSIYHMTWTDDQRCFWFSRLIGNFGPQSIYSYCLNDDVSVEEIRGGGYLVGIVNID